MSDNNQEADIEIVRAAYADRVTDAFRVFAENISMGQDENNCKERFIRAVQLIRKARDMALDAVGDAASAHPAAQPDRAAADAAKSGQPSGQTSDGLSAEDQALIEQALA